MTWFWLALLSAGSNGVVSVIDKMVVERLLRDRWSFPFFIAFFLGLYAIALLAVRGALGLFRLPAAPVLAVALLPGILHYLSAVLYTRALLLTDAATVAALIQTTPLFSVVWGRLVFGEVFHLASYAGIVLTVVCCALLSMGERSGARRVLNPVLLITLAGAALRSLGDLCVKVTLVGQDYWNTLGLSRAALLPIAALLLVHGDHRRLIGQALRIRGAVVLPGMAVLELLAIVPLVLSTIAYALGPLALVSGVRYTTPLFVLVLTLALNRLWAGFVPEPPGRGGVLRRAALTAGILGGVVMMGT